MSMPANERSTFYRQPQRLNPVQLGPDTLLSLSRKRQTLENVISVLKLLEPDDFIDFMQGFYATGLGRFGEGWGYADQLTVLFAAASLLQVENYLEVGVFRGRSLALLASLAVKANLFGFDLWVKEYADLENPGPEYVRSQLARVGYQGEAAFISGRSQETLPRFLEAHPDLYFDIVTVDGDHSYAGALSDLQNALPRVKLGGVLIFDDICHPKHRALEHAWDEAVGSHPDFLSAKYTDIGHGVAVAVRTEAGNDLESAERLQAQLEYDTASSTAGEGGEQQPGVASDKPPASGVDTAALRKTIRNLDGELREQAGTIHNLEVNLQECEADRSARLEAIHALEGRLQECEADRAARLEIIQKLEELRQAHEEALNWTPVRTLLYMRRKLQ